MYSFSGTLIKAECFVGENQKDIKLSDKAVLVCCPLSIQTITKFQWVVGR